MAGLEEIQDYAVMVISVSVLYIMGGVILDNIISTGLINNTSEFYGTVASVESMWSSSLGIMVAVVVIAAAAIVMRQLKGFRN